VQRFIYRVWNKKALHCRRKGTEIIEYNIAIIRSWRSQFGKIPARDFPDNRCYMTRLEIFNDCKEYKIGRRVQRGKGA